MTSASTVGLPRESRISRARINSICVMGISPKSLAGGFACASAGGTKPAIIREPEADIGDGQPEIASLPRSLPGVARKSRYFYSFVGKIVCGCAGGWVCSCKRFRRSQRGAPRTPAGRRRDRVELNSMWKRKEDEDTTPVPQLGPSGSAFNPAASAPPRPAEHQLLPWDCRANPEFRGPESTQFVSWE